MSETYRPAHRNDKKNHYPIRNIGAIAASAAALSGFAINEMNRNHEPEMPAANAPHKVVIAGRDGVPTTAWGIAELAYPDEDPRAVVPMIIEQLPEKDQEHSTIHAGDKFILNEDAEIGTLVDPSADNG